MKQTMLLKLAPTTEQAQALLETMHTFDAACNYIAEQAYAGKVVNKFELQKMTYGTLRTMYHLPAQQAIALEDLRHIRSRTEARLRKSQRAKHSSWSFWQLRFFLQYKAALAGVLLHTVDPRNTSRACSQCGHCEKANRKSQAHFTCKNCGYSCNADWNAAKNISVAAVMQPIVSLGSQSGSNQIGA